MKQGIDYDKTYALVAKWNSIRLILTLTLLHNWKNIQLDYVMAFPQAPLEYGTLYRDPKRILK